jgi:prephenate dehydratase
MIIAFQGLPGAYSHAAAHALFPSADARAYPSFEETLAAVECGEADRAIIPMENAIAGRVSEIQLLLLNTPLHIVAEHFEPIHHCLVGLPGVRAGDVKFVHSHFQALSQCRQNLQRMGVQSVVAPNTAMAAAAVRDQNNPEHGAISSALAAELYGLEILARDMADRPHNVTRFLVMGREPAHHAANQENLMTSFVFRVRNIPAALYKALGGFATNGINMLKLESYIQDSSFIAADFYCEIEGHPDAPLARLAFDEMKFFTQSHRVLGTYAKAPHRMT